MQTIISFRQRKDHRRSLTNTTMDDSTCYILKLPVKLRTMIYEYALQEPELYLRKNSPRAIIPRPTGNQPSLTRVNRQLRAETLSIFYHLNTFTFDWDGLYRYRDDDSGRDTIPTFWGSPRSFHHLGSLRHIKIANMGCLGRKSMLSGMSFSTTPQSVQRDVNIYLVEPGTELVLPGCRQMAFMHDDTKDTPITRYNRLQKFMCLDELNFSTSSIHFIFVHKLVNDICRLPDWTGLKMVISISMRELTDEAREQFWRQRTDRSLEGPASPRNEPSHPWFS